VNLGERTGEIRYVPQSVPGGDDVEGRVGDRQSHHVAGHEGDVVAETLGLE
jgi:hypothetical protein